MVAGQANNATHVRSTKGTFSFSTKGGGKEPSHRRPGTASTVDSFTSALNSPSQVKADLPTPRSSISSTSYGHFDQASRERRFEDMLASGETRRLSETHERDSKNKKLAGRSTAFKVDRREGEASPRRKQGEVLERGQGVLGEEQRESLEEEGDDDEDDYGADEASMAREAAYSPSRLASALSRQTGPGTPRKRLPVHPLSRPGSGQGSETAGTSAASAGHNSTSSARNGGRPSSRGSLGLTPTLDSRVFPSPSPSYTSEFTITSVNSDRSSRGQSTLAAANSLPDSELGRSQATITVAEILKDPQTSEQLHIDKGTNSSSAALSEKSGSALRQRIRKTGGFLKRLGGGNSTDKSRLTPPAGSKVMRKSSQSSLFSESGFSIANSTKSAPGDDNQSRWEQGSSSVPVPSIPTKFKSSNSINQFTIQRAEGKSGASTLR